MILNEEQKVILQDRVSLAVVYWETYQELYDHILTALEHMPHFDDVDKAIDEIIAQDFGGNKGLYQMEKAQARIVRKSVRRRHREYIYDSFKWPGIILTVALTAQCYYYLSNMATNKTFEQGVGFVVYLPFVFVILLGIINMYFFRGLKQSVKYAEIYNIAGFAYFIFFIIKGVFKGVAYEWQSPLLQVINTDFTAIAFVLLLLYTVAFFRLYKDEFKMNIAR